MTLKSLYNSERFLKVLFGAGLFIVLCMGGLAYRYIKQLSDSFKWVQHTYEVHLELENLMSILKEAESGKRGFIISRDSTFLEPVFSSRENLDESMSQLKFLTSDNPEQQKNLGELQIKIDKSLEIFERTLMLAHTGDIESPEFMSAFIEGRRIMNSMQFKINQMTAHENNLLSIRREKSSESLSNAPLLVYLVLILSLTVLLLTYSQLSKNLINLKLKNEQLETYKESSTQSEIVSKHGNWVWNIRDNSFQFSDNLYRLLGEEPQSFEATLENFMSFVHPDDIDKMTEHVNQMLDAKEFPYITYRIIQKNGVIRYFKAYGKAMFDEFGHNRLLGTTADITDEIENFTRLEEKNIELQRNNRELASFNYVASHDLQEPLRKIQTFISRLEDKESEKLSSTGKLYIDRIKTSSARMRSLIDDLLQFSRTNKSDQIFEISNMNMLLEAAKQDLAEVIVEKNATIISDKIPAINVIPFQIKQLFLNLISNSLKYSRENVDPVISITYSKTKAKHIPKLNSSKYKSYHTITFVDNGIGFEQDYAEKIFVLFNRLHNKSEYSGTGIGLSICKKIVENHNGFISAQSELGDGATFKVYLPLK